MEKIFAVFPGQGSQTVGMGKDLYEASDIARECFNAADKALGFSLSSICFEGPADKLTSTAIAQPAILLTSVISYRLSPSTTRDKVVVAAGHSLGEYSALVAMGAISLEDAVQLVHKRGCYMQEAVPAGVGKMVAILGKEVEEIEAALAKVTTGVASIANINAPGQVVIAGDVAGIDEGLAHLGTAKAIPLQVSAPFHCSLMKPAEIALSKDLDALTIQAPQHPVIANFSATPVSAPEEIRSLLKSQVCGRVRWVESVTTAIQTFAPTAMVEFGAGSVLTGLQKRIDSKLPRYNIYHGNEIH
jgi:[acyl-carrier-protein] S-malonyltransferase